MIILILLVLLLLVLLLFLVAVAVAVAVVVVVAAAVSSSVVVLPPYSNSLYRATIKGRIYLQYEYCSTAAERGQFSRATLRG